MYLNLTMSVIVKPAHRLKNSLRLPVIFRNIFNLIPPADPVNISPQSRDAAHHYGIPFSYEVREKYSIRVLMPQCEGDPYSYENQTVDRVALMLDLLDKYQTEDIVCLPSHCGFVDAGAHGAEPL